MRTHSYVVRPLKRGVLRARNRYGIVWGSFPDGGAPSPLQRERSPVMNDPCIAGFGEIMLRLSPPGVLRLPQVLPGTLRGVCLPGAGGGAFISAPPLAGGKHLA